MFDEGIMMINICNKLFNSLFTNKAFAQDNSNSACAAQTKKKVVEFTFWTAAPTSIGNCRMPAAEAALSFCHSDSPHLGWFHGQWRQRLLFHCSWGHEDLGEELMGSQRKSNPSGVSGFYWFMSVLWLPIIPYFLKRRSNSLVLPLRDFNFFFFKLCCFTMFAIIYYYATL